MRIGNALSSRRLLVLALAVGAATAVAAGPPPAQCVVFDDPNELFARSGD